jgi:hypothetical protein
VDSGDYGTLAQVIATLFVALAVETAAASIASDRKPGTSRKFLDRILGVLAGIATGVLALDILSMADIPWRHGVVGNQLVYLNLFVIALMGVALMLAPVMRSIE